ncbi:hypothetical protein [Ruegeria arenilitoris]|uniref:hypothetical protein n=1 Tax=Ruegeria arenilitoris TaxID=1173585 RepID=UPI001480E94D|nr:hypothetical protein [Ruegeria arenilitoris]
MNSTLTVLEFSKLVMAAGSFYLFSLVILVNILFPLFGRVSGAKGVGLAETTEIPQQRQRRGVLSGLKRLPFVVRWLILLSAFFATAKFLLLWFDYIRSADISALYFLTGLIYFSAGYFVRMHWLRDRSKSIGKLDFACILFCICFMFTQI